MSIINKLRKMLTKNVVDIGQALVSLNVPGKVLTDDLSSAYIEVGETNILRLEIAVDTYVAFDNKTIGGIVSVTTSPAVKLVGAGVHYVVCQCDYVRTSVNPVRIELLEF